MKETRTTPADPLQGLAPPGAPPELRARVLEASRAALLAGPAPRRDRWRLLFASRPLRLAWAASVLLLLAGHALLVRPAPPRADAAALPPSRSASEADAELAAIRSLPRIDPDARSLGASPDGPSRPARPPRHDQPKENRT